MAKSKVRLKDVLNEKMMPEWQNFLNHALSENNRIKRLFGNFGNENFYIGAELSPRLTLDEAKILEMLKWIEVVPGLRSPKIRKRGLDVGVWYRVSKKGIEALRANGFCILDSRSKKRGWFMHNFGSLFGSRGDQ